MLPLLAVAAGAVVGYRLPPSGRERTGVSGFVLLLVVVVATALPRLTDVSGVAAFLVSQFALCAFLIHNRRHPGTLVIAVGIALNALPIVVNGGMPVSVSASEAVGVEAPTSAGSHHLPMGDNTRLNFLGDAIPFVPTGQVLSFGDVVMLAGFAVTSATVVRTAKTKGEVQTEDSPTHVAVGEKAPRVLGRVWE